MKTSTLTVMLGLVFLFGAAILCVPKLKDNPIPTTSIKTNFPTTTKSRHEEKFVSKPEKKLTFGLRANFEGPNQ